LFEAIIGPRGPGSVERALTLIGFNLLSDYIRDYFEEKGKRPPTTLNRAWARLTKLLDIEGMVIKHMEVGEVKDRQDFTNGCPSHSLYTDDHENDFDILEGLRLLRYTDTGFFQVSDRWEVKVMAYYVSSLGLSFAAACGVQGVEPWWLVINWPGVIRQLSGGGISGARRPLIPLRMFAVSEADAAAIRAVFEQRGELSAAVELRRLYPGITDNAQARECARTIASWKPLPVAPRAAGRLHR
jgi:hypothetical protein